MKVALALGAAIIALAAAAPASAGVTSIKITSKTNDYIQIAEVQALVGTQNVALASNGTVATAYSSLFGFTGPDKTIDGLTGGDPYGDGIYISGGTSPAEFLLITFARPYNLTSLSILGREDANQDRDKYNFQLFDGLNPTGHASSSTGSIDSTGQGASNIGTFSFAAGTVPEPAVWGMMLAGFGLVGGAMRSRRRIARVAIAA